MEDIQTDKELAEIYDRIKWEIWHEGIYDEYLFYPVPIPEPQEVTP